MTRSALAPARVASPLSAHPSWRLEGIAAQTLPAVHTRSGVLSPTEVSEYHLAYARQELERPLAYYEARIERLGLAGAGVVLDAGCGIGQWSLALALHNDEVHGIDRMPERLAIGELLSRAHDIDNVHFTDGDLEELPYADATFDAAVCYGVFMFLQQERAMSELARTLRPGGRLYVSGNGVGWSLLLIAQRRLVRTGARTIARTLLRREPDNFLTKRRMTGLLRRHGLEPTAWGGEGRLAVHPAPAVDPVYPKTYAGATCVWELLAEKRRGLRADVRPAVNVDVDGLRRRGTSFEPAERAVDAAVRHVSLADATESEFGADRIAAARARLAGQDQEAYLDAVAARVTVGAATPQEAVEAVILFLQETMFHHPLRQPPVALDVAELLEVGEGRCGHVARIAVDMFRRAGFSARTRQLPRHIVAEVFLHGQWRLADPDAFKNGVVPRRRDGSLLTVRDLEENPYQIDRFPLTGLWARPGTVYARNAAGEEVTGYIDAVEPHIRGYPSTLYTAWAEREHPPSIPGRLRSETADRHVRLAWDPSTDPDGDLRAYRVRIGTRSKGWSWDDVVYERLTAETGIEVGLFETEETTLEVEVDRPGTYYWSVTAVDDHLVREPETFYWSSDERSFRIG